MSIDCIAGHKLEDTGLNDTMSLIQGKYKMFILGAISYETLSSTLKVLEADGLIHRKEYPQIPPKVEYRLSEKGRSLIPILEKMCDWGETHRDEAVTVQTESSQMSS